MDQSVVAAEFRARFGRDAEIIAAAPGRLNLIGEHTDYSGGFAMPVAIDRTLFVAAARTDGPSVLHSHELGEGESFDAADLAASAGGNWSKYAAGMAWALGAKVNLQAYVVSDVPIASRVSSSAAMEMAFGIVYNELGGLGLDNKTLALRGQKCENQFIGLQSGNMDQLASAVGKAGHAMLLDTRSLDIRYVPIPAHLIIALCDTRYSRELAGSEYNNRRADCEEATRILGVPMLRDATMADLLALQGDMPGNVFRRVRHILSENQRCLDFVDALEQDDEQRMGDLMRASHQSLHDDYEVTVPQLDIMARAANSAPGCVGARMTGGGFGGACVALVHRERFASFRNSVMEDYAREAGKEGAVFACEAAEGAQVQFLNLAEH